MSDLMNTHATLPSMPSTSTMTMQIMLNEALFERAKEIARYISNAQGFTPPHLIGKPEACFAVVINSLTWQLNPFQVAQSTYSTPGGKVGYEGKLCQAILENSGQLEGGVKFSFYGDWDKVQGKFEMKNSSDGKKKYPAQAWTQKDEEGVGVTISAKVRGEDAPRTINFDLKQAHPRNSTLWATDPKTQLCYAGVRRFCSTAMPGIFMGIPFDVEDSPAHIRDITPAQNITAAIEALPIDPQAQASLNDLLERAKPVVKEPLTPDPIPQPVGNPDILKSDIVAAPSHEAFSLDAAISPQVEHPHEEPPLPLNDSIFPGDINVN
ncbi:MAG: recombinase RecT [Alphaproteobacteria bacterium]|nr:recombinase RecT [Alphaproteobacteria bacterium]